MLDDLKNLPSEASAKAHRLSAVSARCDSGEAGSDTARSHGANGSMPPHGSGDPHTDCRTRIRELEAERAALRAKCENLEIALTSSREIGAAIGVLMARHGLTQTEAFGTLRIVSQRAHRKLRELADEVLFTGTLETPQLSEVVMTARSSARSEAAHQ